MKDYYEILEVHPKASQEVIKKAYYVLAKKYHPDSTNLEKNIANEKMQELNEAYGILSNEGKRRRYDASRNRTSSSSASTASTEASTKSGHNENVYDDDKHKIAIICDKYLGKIRSSIVKDTAYCSANLQKCDALYKLFTNEISPYYNKIIASNCKYGAVEELLYHTYRSFAVSYTWGGDFVKAASVIKIAGSFLSKQSQFYDEYLALSKKLQQDASIQEKEKRKDYNSPGVIRFILQHFWLVIGFLFAAYMWYTVGFSNTNKKDVNVKKNTNQSQQYKRPAAANIVAVPRTGISTGYDSSFIQSNSTGLCMLTIDNSRNAEPVYVRLWSVYPPKPVRAAYIAAYDSFTMTNITPSTYEIRYKYLYQQKKAERGVKSQNFTMIQEETASGTNYSVQSITLYKVHNGNFHTQNIDVDDI